MKTRNILLTFCLILIAIYIGAKGYCWFIDCEDYSTKYITNEINSPQMSAQVPNFKVAFIADQGLNDNSLAVLQLIKDENADMVLHQGDFDYVDDPQAWDNQINSILGADFPYFASIGNHDTKEWEGYQQKLQTRLEKITGADCEGELGVKSACSYNGIFFILSGVGTMGYDHESFIRDQLSTNNYTWKICSWHKNQRLMQIGGKGDKVGWGAYDECRKGGAIIATGHEHSYSRTYLMDGFFNQSVASYSNTLVIAKGRTFTFISGLAGLSIRSADKKLSQNEWWASVYTLDNGADYGALFCTFNVDASTNKAHCYFKDIGGNIIDEFDVISRL